MKSINFIFKTLFLIICMLGILISGVYSQTQKHTPSDQRGDVNFRAFSNIDGKDSFDGL